MNIPREFKGTVYFWWNVKYGWMSLSETRLDPEEYIALGEADVSVTFNMDGVAFSVCEAFDKAIARAEEEAAHRIEGLKAEKQKFLALDHKGDQ